MRSAATLAFAATAAFAVAGCESSSSILGGGGEQPSIALSPATTPQASTQAAKLQIAPIIGSPDAIARDLATQLTTAIERRGLTVAKAPGSTGEFVLRGYIVAAREKAGSKVSYIWDVTDAQGRRVHRVTGEEMAGSAAGKDPWSTVSPQIIQAIADRTAAQIAQWAPSAGSPAIASAAPGSSAPAAASPSAPPQSVAMAPAQPATPPAATATTGSIRPSGPVMTLVPPITGAPGDGSASLTQAIQRELSKNGMTLATAPGAATYRVEGKVAMGQPKDGKQPIQIDWNVVDPAGKKLGTVSQKNDVPQGSLDGAWGKTADAAAQAAASGILKLLPQKTAAN